MKIDLSNKHVLVTGGTKGIGEAIVNKFLNVGAKVTATGTKAQEIQNLNTHLRKVVSHLNQPQKD